MDQPDRLRPQATTAAHARMDAAAMNHPQDNAPRSPVSAAPAKPARAAARPGAMSYKFQRLREKLREAITNGEFPGKLPGERALAKRFHVNAKTLSKALTDLAAEGLLDRSIGRGTYVKGTAPAPHVDGRWLVVCDADRADACLVRHLKEVNPHVEVTTDVANVRPSYLNQFHAVIDAAAATPESFVRDLVVRNVPVVAVGHEPRTYSVHAILADAALGVAQVARDLVLGGHRRLAAVEEAGSTLVARALRQAAARYAPDATVDACSPADAPALLANGHGAGAGAVTALVCDSGRSAERVAAALHRHGVAIPRDVSLAAVGCACDQAPCSGYFVPCRHVTESIVRLLRDAPARPTALWLAGEHADRGTTAPVPGTDTPLTRPAVTPMRLEGMLA